MNAADFSRFLSISLLLIFSLSFTQCTKEDEDYYFDESYLIGIWRADSYDTFDGEAHEGFSEMRFFISHAELNGGIYPWALLNYEDDYGYYRPYSTLKFGSANFKILELTNENLSFIDQRSGKNHIWYYTRQ